MADRVEGAGVVAVAEVGGRRAADLPESQRRHVMRDFDEPLGSRVGQRTQQHAVDDAEHRRGGPDAQRQGRHDDHGETRRTLQAPGRESHVAPEVLEAGGPPLLAHLLAHRLPPAESQQRLAARLFGSEPLPAELLRLLLHVEADLVLEPFVERLALPQCAEALPAVSQHAHRSPQSARLACNTSRMALDMRSHCASESSRCRRPRAVSE